MLNPVTGCTQCHSSLLTACADLSQHIPLRSHLIGIPVRYFTLIHLESIMKFRNRNHIPGSRFLEQIRPLLRIKALSPKHGDKILIPKILMRPIGLDMMFVFRRILNIHISWIPFVSKRRNAEDPPVDKNPEFCVSVPFWNLIGRQ